MKKLLRFIKAHAMHRLVWRVTYVNGDTTRLLYKEHAYGQKSVFGGKMWIDYDKGFF